MTVAGGLRFFGMWLEYWRRCVMLFDISDTRTLV